MRALMKRMAATILALLVAVALVPTAFAEESGESFYWRGMIWTFAGDTLTVTSGSANQVSEDHRVLDILPVAAVYLAANHQTIGQATTNDVTAKVTKINVQDVSLPEDSSQLFENFSGDKRLPSVEEVNFTNVDTSQVTKADDMFNGCDTLKVVNMPASQADSLIHQAAHTQLQTNASAKDGSGQVAQEGTLVILSNDGSNQAQVYTLSTGGRAVELPVLTREHYSLVDFTESQDGATPEYSAGDTVSFNDGYFIFTTKDGKTKMEIKDSNTLTLYAQWKELPATTPETKPTEHGQSAGPEGTKEAPTTNSETETKTRGQNTYPAGTVAVYRLYNPFTGEHLFTLNVNEYSYLGTIGWNREDISWRAPESGTAVYRLFNRYEDTHLYTTNKAEYDHLVTLGWNGEDVALYSAADGGTPVYRLYNPYSPQGLHLFTTDKSEYDKLATIGWQQEGVALRGVSIDAAN